ncbi:chemotaxis protein [Clostridium felsineum]|uniref:Stage 0 sporulation protein A homolog n=1 Tax=Clostridium felsineum TaxID=36839 RepID=A0A1S8MB44_9CLOT|nr:chemotaxis protein [Clostridium felsineum]MCR3758252.1 chemotaxis protein [Clostridium felsineum]URZ01206.1 Chemotaxis protein CheV [Clostridium felsineum]URZ06038.1 Chemotaxis protein CheV [Clostridium felsineum]URZ11075.1 Chemotaxis protein CheV [Clostridium felsineum]URZ15704.1 Chemotaxis protein CheV [Clostridium felsineum DSM 794]
MESNILLESGTGELEVLEFVIGDRHFAINIIKVKEVVEVEGGKITKLPETNPAIAGLILCRNEIITLVDLKYVITKGQKVESCSKVIICEFNKVRVAFNIDAIVGVHRVKWEEILKPDNVAENPLVIGHVILGDKILLMLDFEKIVTDISPSTGISQERIGNIEYDKNRATVRIAMADDSTLIRKLLKNTLNKAGFTNLHIFDDGKQLLNYLEEVVEKKGEKVTEEVQLVITDIEMPQMDGHALTRKIKEHPLLRRIPVIIFSSLITGDLKHKGESVGADAQISKPEVGELVRIIEELINKNNI